MMTPGRARALVWLLAGVLLAGTPACKKKKKTETPDATTPGSMSDKDPVGGEGLDGGGDLPGSGGGDAGGDAGGDDTDAPDSGAPRDPDKPAEIVFPNLDTPPEEARKQVVQHLATARALLAASTPDPDAAIRAAQQALAADSTSIDAQVTIAHAYYIKRLYDTAEVLLDMLHGSRAEAKQNAGVFYVYGLIYDQRKDYDRALKAYTMAVNLNPAFASAHINLGVHQLRNKQYDMAVATYEKVSGALGQTSAEVYNSLGSAYRGRSAGWPAGAPDNTAYLRKAEDAFKRALTLRRDYATPYYNLGLLYLDADPFPGPAGALDTLVRLGQAKTYFEEYKSKPGADLSLVEARLKDVSKLIKREEKKRKK
ncbi:MAG: tetratricopeptide repeat protein [Myxococcales bacterium]|nr:tetratricopeptide repeat protein [Myxococcales bacterium]